jgi:hypothetical protein
MSVTTVVCLITSVEIHLLVNAFWGSAEVESVRFDNIIVYIMYTSLLLWFLTPCLDIDLYIFYVSYIGNLMGFPTF